MSVAICYHDKCADGFIAACCAHERFRLEGVDHYFVTMQYGREHEDMKTLFELMAETKTTAVYILDFSLLKADEDYLRDIMRVSVVTIDHHKSAAKRMGDNISRCSTVFSHDNSQSGALLAAHNFGMHGINHDELFDVAREISEYDTWQKRFGEERADQVAAGIYFFMRKYNYDVALAIADMTMPKILGVGSVVLQTARFAVDAAFKHSIRIKLPNSYRHGWMVNAATEHRDILGHKLASIDGSYGITWEQGNHPDKIKVSIRTKDGTADALAQYFGGGGHDNAASFTTNMETIQGWIVYD